MRLHEVAATLWERADALGLTLVLYGQSHRREIASRRGTLLMSNGAPAWHAFLVPFVPDEIPLYNDIHFGEWGWVELFVPRETYEILEMSELRVMSLWWNEGTSWAHPNNAPQQNMEALSRFRKVSAAFRRQLTYPVYGYHIRNVPPTMYAYRDIAYSPGAAKWFYEGKRLRQRLDGLAGFSIDGTVREDLSTATSI